MPRYTKESAFIKLSEILSREMLHEYWMRTKSMMDLLFKAMGKSPDQFEKTSVIQARFKT